MVRSSEDEASQGLVYGKWLIGLAFCILLAVTSLKFCFEHLLSYRDDGISGALQRQEIDLLLIGSSHTRQTYDMRLLERTTGIRASYMCAYGGNDLSMTAQILEYLAKQPDRLPHRIIAEAYSSKLATPPDLEDPRYFFDAPPELKIEIIKSYLRSKQNAGAWLDIFDLAVNRGNDQILAYPAFLWAERIVSYKGGKDSNGSAGVSASEFAAFHDKGVLSQPDRAQVDGFYRIVALARRYHISLYFVESPMPAPVSASPRIQNLKRVFREMAAAEGIPYIDGDQGFPTDNPAFFADDNHLSQQGSDLFTTRISEQLSRWMAPQLFTRNRGAPFSK